MGEVWIKFKALSIFEKVHVILWLAACGALALYTVLGVVFFIKMLPWLLS